MKKTALLVIFILGIYHFATAQYATSGTGLLRDEIWWFNWAGMNLAGTDSRTVTLPDGLVVTYTYSGGPVRAPLANVMNTWSGAVLHFLYDFTDPAIKPAIHHYTSFVEQYPFTINVTATRNGVPVPFTLVAADAEASSTLEVTQLTTNGGPWQAVDFYRNSFQTSNPLNGCNTTNIYINDTYGGAAASGQNPIIASTSTTGNISVSTVLDHKVFGGMAMTFGIMAPIDRGDLPASYGTVQHGLSYSINNGCSYLAPLPSATQSQTLKLGAVAGDADGAQTLDDNANGIDEDGVSAFSVYNYSGSYSVPVTLNNTTGSDAWLTGWFDYNRNGIFDNGESATVAVPNNATTATITWTGLPAYLPKGGASGYAFRFRLSSDQQATQSPTGYAKDGEVEDYFVTSTSLCSINIKTINDTAVCAAQPVQLTTTGTSVIDYSWNNPSFLSSASIADPVSRPEITTTYTVTGSNPQGCEAKDAVTITVTPGPLITMSNDTIICSGSSVQLSATSPGAVVYTWLPQTGLNNYMISTPVAQPAAATTYVVLVQGSNGCTREDSVKIAFHQPPSFAVTPANVSICEEDTIQLMASGGDDYTWLAENNTILGNDAALLIQPSTSQTYQVVIKENTCNTTDTRSIPVIVKANPTPAITKSNDIDCSTGQAFLHASGGISYVWNDMPGIYNITAADPMVKPAQTTTYTVNITNSYGCSVKDSITVLADFAKAMSTYPVPSAFTPNNDGRNDCFGLKLWGQVIELQFQVFNRWGERVFSTTDPTHCWDGRYKGVLQPAGGYVYRIKAITRCGSVNRSGMVMLIR